MPITFTKQGFNDVAQAQAALQKTAMHVTELDVEPVKNDAHWHNFDARLYITEGELKFTDVERGEVYECSAGSILDVPQGSLHAEESAGGYKIMLGTSIPAQDITEPVNRDPASRP